MKQTTSPSHRIYNLYAEYESRGLDTSPIRNALKTVTGTVSIDNMEVVQGWLDEFGSFSCLR